MNVRPRRRSRGDRPAGVRRPGGEAGKVDGPRGGVNLRRTGPESPRDGGSHLPSPTVLLALLVALAGAACGGSDRPAPVEPSTIWSAYLGDQTRDGYRGERVPEEEPRTVWRTGVARGLVAPPVVTGPVAVVATTSRTVVTVSTSTGEKYWEDQKSGPFQAPPLLDGDRLYAAADVDDGEVHAMRLRDGEDRWKREVGPVTEPLLLDAGVLYLVSGRPPAFPSRVHALDPEDGSVLWETRLPHRAVTGPLAVGDRILVPTIRDSLYALRRDGGEIVDRIGLGGEVSAEGTVAGDTVFLPFHDGSVAALRGEDLRELWRVSVDAPVLATPVATRDGLLWVLDRSARLWSIDRAGGGLRRVATLESTARGSLAVVGDVVLVGLLNGRLTAVARGTGEPLWSVKFDDSVRAPPAVFDGQVYVPLLRGDLVKLR